MVRRTDRVPPAYLAPAASAPALRAAHALPPHRLGAPRACCQSWRGGERDVAQRVGAGAAAPRSPQPLDAPAKRRRRLRQPLRHAPVLARPWPPARSRRDAEGGTRRTGVARLQALSENEPRQAPHDDEADKNGSGADAECEPSLRGAHRSQSDGGQRTSTAGASRAPPASESSSSTSPSSSGNESFAPPTFSTTISSSKQYLSVSERDEAERPGSALELGMHNFGREFRAMLRALGNRVTGVRENERLPGALGFTLDDAAVAEREREREERTGFKSRSPRLTRFAYDVACRILDAIFAARPIPRFWFLETVARMPYFSYLSVLHLYETFGWLHIAELRKIHFAEEWNEMHHLLVMSSLGGDARWADRLLAFHLSLVYYWGLVALYLVSPAMSYNFSELLEAHAVDTYTQFLEENAHRLRELPAPDVARRYYRAGDLYMFDEFHTDHARPRRRPPVDNLYDVFVNIRDDEEEHVKTMVACQDYSMVGTLVSSPHQRPRGAAGSGSGGGDDDSSDRGNADGDRVIGDETQVYHGLKGENRERWLRWADAINRDAREREQKEQESAAAGAAAAEALGEQAPEQGEHVRARDDDAAGPSVDADGDTADPAAPATGAADATATDDDGDWRTEMERQRASDAAAWQAKMKRMRAAAAAAAASNDGDANNGDDGLVGYDNGLGL